MFLIVKFADLKFNSKQILSFIINNVGSWLDIMSS